MTFTGSSRDGATASAGCWVFDVDGCLVDSLTGSSLRRGARDLLAQLAAGGVRVILWSAGGDRYARARAEQFGLDGLVDAYHAKSGRDPEGHYATTHLGVGPGPAVFVDDRPEDLAGDLDVRGVSPYLADDPHDRVLEELAAAARLAGGEVLPGAAGMAGSAAGMAASGAGVAAEAPRPAGSGGTGAADINEYINE